MNYITVLLLLSASWQCISQTCDPEVDAYEPNDSFYDGTQINLPASIGGLTLCASNDTQDWFSFPIGGNTGTINIIARWQTPIDYLDFVIWSPQQTSATTYRSQLTRTDREFIQIDLSNRTLDSMGSWWLDIVPKDKSLGGTYNFSASWSPYPPCRPDSYEPNDGLTSATLIQTANFTIASLSMCNDFMTTQNVGDQDYFKIEPQLVNSFLTTSISYRINNFSLALLDESGNQLYEADGSTPLYRKLDAIPIDANQTYFLRISEIDGADTFPHAPSYSFSVSINPQPLDSSTTFSTAIPATTSDDPSSDLPSTFTHSASSQQVEDGQAIQSRSSSNRSSIIGIAVGSAVGVFCLAGILVGIIFILKRHKKSQDEIQVEPRRNISLPQSPVVPKVIIDRGAGTVPPDVVSTISSAPVSPLPMGRSSTPMGRSPTPMGINRSRTSSVFTSAETPESPKQPHFNINFAALSPLQPVGQGSHGVVYRGKWRAMDVAVKQMNAEIAKDEKALSDFYREAELLSRLRPHPNVILFIGVTQSPLAIVTEFCSGGSLFDMICEGRDFSMKQIKLFLLGIARGMLHLHAEGIIHRDLAARNVLLTEKLDPKISDFGLSRELAEGPRQTTALTGPLRWMAPESIRERIYSKESDVWAFGITAWELVTHETPYHELDAVNAAIGVGYDHLRLEVPRCDGDVEEIMKGCWMEDPEKRPTFEEIAKKLEREEDMDRIRGKSFSTRTFEYGCMSPANTDTPSQASPSLDATSIGSDDTQEIPANFRPADE